MQKRAKPKFATNFFFFVVYVGEILCPLRCVQVHVCVCVCIAAHACVCVLLCVCVNLCAALSLGASGRFASYRLTCALDLLSILFVIIVVVYVSV